MSIVFGLYQADSGKIKVSGKEINLKSPRDSIENGIGMVHQHFMLVENFTVLENIVLGFLGHSILFTISCILKKSSRNDLGIKKGIIWHTYSSNTFSILGLKTIFDRLTLISEEDL